MRGKQIAGLCFTLLLLVGIGTMVGAVEPYTCPEGVKECIDGWEEMSQTGDLMVLTGTETQLVRVILDDTVLYARVVTIHDQEDDRWALLEDMVRVERPDTVITSEQAQLDLDDDVYLFEGAVHVLEQKEKLRKIWADQMEYDGETGNMTAEGSVRMEEEGRRFQAMRMVYDAEAETALLEQDVIVVDDRGEITAQRLDINLADETFKGAGPGRIILRETREESEGSKPVQAADE